MTDLSSEEQRRIREIAEKWGSMANPRRNYREYMKDRFTKALKEQALSHAREKEEMKAEGADYTSTTEKAFASLSAERDELKRRVEQTEEARNDLYKIVCQCMIELESVDCVPEHCPPIAGIKAMSERIDSLEAALKTLHEESPSRLTGAPKEG